MKIKWTPCLLIFALAAMILGGCGTEEISRDSGNSIIEDSQESSEIPVSSPAPAPEAELPGPVTFEAQDIDGNSVSSDIFPGVKLTMINVWATYCNPCLREMPDLGELAGEYEATDFQLIGIVSDVPEGSKESVIEEAKRLIEQTNAVYPHLLLNESLYNALLTEVTAVPTTFFLDKEGNILNTVVGSMSKEDWKETIDALLEEL